MMLTALLAIWLGIFGPMPDGFAKWLQGWQTLLAATVALGAASVAYWNTQRTLAHSESLEAHRRERKHTALRAVLPLALAEIGSYADQTARNLLALIVQCREETLPPDSVGDDFVPALPSDTLKSLADFIEFSDSVNIDVLASTVAVVQIHHSRLLGLRLDNHAPLRSRIITRSNLEESIVDAAIIQAGAASAFNYARRRRAEMPDALLWDDVTRALRNMGFWDDEHPRVHEYVTRRSERSRGPFEIFTHRPD